MSLRALVQEFYLQKEDEEKSGAVVQAQHGRQIRASVRLDL